MHNPIDSALSRLDGWLRGMRGPAGYGGPISHWWDASLIYCGPMADWRYEGLICGYLTLHERTDDRRWLERACACGDDLLAAQLPTGCFANSAFQQGPMDGGTPHEAAVDLALLSLARHLRARNDERWQHYAAAAERNIEQYQLGKLWRAGAFRDQEWNQIAVPNKNATTMEALLLYEELSGRSMTPYISGARDVILASQVVEAGPRQGATVHHGTSRHRLTIGIYTARCAAALVRLHEHQPDQRLLDAVGRMVAFLCGLVTPRGSLFGRYADGGPIACPLWVSPSGDLLRALLVAQRHIDVPGWAIEQLVAALLEQQQPSGGLPTALSLAARGARRPHRGLPDFRDQLPVVGWCDKAFRALSMLATAPSPTDDLPLASTLLCSWRGRRCRYEEDAWSITLTDLGRGQRIFAWEKGTCYPAIYQL
jgi:hypothetical protein